MGSDPARGERCQLADFVFRRWKQMVEADPAKAREQPCQALVENDQPWLKNLLDHVPDLVKGVTEAYEGITVEAFEQAVGEFFATATHPTLGLPYTKVGYQPMRELLDLLHARDFTVFICSGRGRDFMWPRYLKAVSAALTAVVLASVYEAIANPDIELVKKIPKGPAVVRGADGALGVDVGDVPARCLRRRPGGIPRGMGSRIDHRQHHARRARRQPGVQGVRRGFDRRPEALRKPVRR